MKRRAIAALVLGATSLALTSAIWVGGAGAKSTGKARQYVVLYEQGVTASAARAAIKSSGGQVVRENTTIGLATVVSKNPNFVKAATATKALRSAGRNRPVGRSKEALVKKLDLSDLDEGVRASSSGSSDDDDGNGGEPLANLQWDMKMIHATPDGSYDEQKGRKKVLVGIIDTGIDASHPDLAPNFSTELSRNFTVDIPSIDGPCEDEPDKSCNDPANVDEEGHGSHTAGTVGAAINGIGIAGVAPGVTLVNLRAGQDSGFFFLQSTLDAMTYAADNGIDVVNMSYFTDPWLFNCRSNPADSPAEQAEQALIIDATQRASNYARAHGVTLVSALGNENTDMGLPQPIIDTTSPDFPPGTEKTRTVDNSCIDVPAETDGVISVSSVGPSGAKSNFSNYGLEQTDLSAPGGFGRDFFGTPQFNKAENRVLSPIPEQVAKDNGFLNPDGTPTPTSRVVRDCQNGVCAYYRWEHGTSMAAPHVVGVAALIVSEFGSRKGKGITMDPAEVERILKETATKTACPNPPLVDYSQIDVAIGLPPGDSALCQGTLERNGFYGDGIVDALAAVTAGDDGNGRGRGRGH
jgi:lantibiotic leader peptide-processing serine protease